MFTRRSLLSRVIPAGACFFARVAAGAAPRSEHIDARLAGDRIRIAAPQLQFVTGKPLERLENGSPVPFAIQLTLSPDRFVTILQRDIERFVFSYDLWEEKFAITRLGRPAKSVSHLPARAAEAWCIAEMGVPPGSLANRQPFWLRLDVRAENPGDEPAITGEGMTLTRLVEIFSRRTKNDPSRWSIEGGPFRLADLKQARPEVAR